jgi:hypothetical protein
VWEEARMAGYQAGDRVRVIQVPPYLYRDDPVDRITAQFFERCLGQAFRVQDLDEHGQLELWATDAGTEAPDRMAHTIWIEPEYVAPDTGAGRGAV